MKDPNNKKKSDPDQIDKGLDFNLRGLAAILLVALASFLLLPSSASAIPAFARQYGISCATCHAAFPRLNSFGKNFIENNYRLDNWKENTLQTGDDMLQLPKVVPLALRVIAYVQSHQANDNESGIRRGRQQGVMGFSVALHAQAAVLRSFVRSHLLLLCRDRVGTRQ